MRSETEWRVALRRATVNAAGEMSVAKIEACGNSFARAMAMQPEPVPMSAICKPSPVNDDVFGFGAGNQDVGRYFKLETPEFLFAGEVLRWLS